MSDQVERNWDLSLYELHRTPQEAITDDTEIAVSARSLQSELTCPICLDMLTQTMTTKECLHRFCAECIITALRSGNKECPTCRKKLVSKRSLRPDPNFDQLVEKIFPNRQEYEEHQERFLESLSRSHSQNFITSITDGIKAQMAHVKALNRRKNLDDAPESPHHTPIGTEPSTPRHRESDEEDGGAQVVPKKKKKVRPSTENDQSDSQASSSHEIEIVFKPHPLILEDKEIMSAMKENATRYIKTTSRALVEHLCKYLAMRISLDLPPNKSPSAAGDGASDTKPTGVKDLTIYIAPTPGQLLPVGGTFSLTQINEKYWKVNKPMEMFYSFQRS